jgi:hypothetical protein
LLTIVFAGGKIIKSSFREDVMQPEQATPSRASQSVFSILGSEGFYKYITAARWTLLTCVIALILYGIFHRS